MILIVEGIDRVGKTTLCDKISKELGIKKYKRAESDFDFSKMDNMNETDKMLQMIELYDLLEGDIIFDRFHLTDYVYGCIDRGYNVSDAIKNFRAIEDKLLNDYVVLILVEPTNVEMSSEEHGSDLSNHAKLFDICFSKSKLKKIKCDYNSLNITTELMKGFFDESMHKRNC